MNNISSTEKFIQVGFNEIETLKIKELVASHEPGIYIFSRETTETTETTQPMDALFEYIINNEIFQNEEGDDTPEYLINGASELSIVREKRDLFHTAISRAMCMPPEVMMVSNIDDQDKAQTAVNAAQAGHRVWSTVISSPALSENEAIDYLAGLGVPTSLIRGVIVHP